MARSQANRISFNRLHPFVLSDPFDKTAAFSAGQPRIVASAPTIPYNWTKQYHVYLTMRADSHRSLIDATANEILAIAIDSVWLCVYFIVQLMRHCVNEHSPLLLFSWWRNKIS